MPECPRCGETVTQDETHCPACATDLRVRGARAGDVILVLDRGLVQFGKYAVAILGLVLLIGAFFLGFDLKKLVSEMQDRRVELAQAAVNLEGGKQMAEANAKQLEAQTALAKAGFKKAIDDLEAKLANADEQVTALKAAVAQAEQELQEIKLNREESEVLIQDIVALRADGSFLVKSQTVVSRQEGTIRPGRDKLFVPGTVLTYAFIDEVSDETKTVVAEVTQEWMQYANLRFTHVDKIADATIRIGLKSNEGTWSYIGRDNLSVDASSPTMNLTWVGAASDNRDVIRHEFGHVLGLTHEHQNPRMPDIWNKEAVFETFSAPPNFWTREQVEFNILRKIAADQYPCSRGFDPNSVMMYAFAGEITASGEPITPTPGLSASDKACAREMYPPS